MNQIISHGTVLTVRNVIHSAEYYRDKLGFRFSTYWGEPPTFCMVWREESCFLLNQVDDIGLIRPLSTVCDDLWDAYLWVRDVKVLFRELSSKDANIKYGPQEKDYGVLEMVVQDIDGYEIAFGQEL